MSLSHAPQPEAIDSLQDDTDARANVRSSTALTSAKRNLRYLYDPKSAGPGRPNALRTRALLRVCHYIGVFVFWRIVRYAKYALIGSAIAAIGATAFGGAVSGAAFVLAPPTLISSVGIGIIWSLGKWGFRKFGVGEKVAMEAERGRENVKKEGQLRDIQGPEAIPW